MMQKNPTSNPMRTSHDTALLKHYVRSGRLPRCVMDTDESVEVLLSIYQGKNSKVQDGQSSKRSKRSEPKSPESDSDSSEGSPSKRSSVSSSGRSVKNIHGFEKHIQRLKRVRAEKSPIQDCKKQVSKRPKMPTQGKKPNQTASCLKESSEANVRAVAEVMPVPKRENTVARKMAPKPKAEKENTAANCKAAVASKTVAKKERPAIKNFDQAVAKMKRARELREKRAAVKPLPPIEYRGKYFGFEEVDDDEEDTFKQGLDSNDASGEDTSKQSVDSNDASEVEAVRADHSSAQSDNSDWSPVLDTVELNLAE